VDTTTAFTRHGITLPVVGIGDLCRKYQVVERPSPLTHSLLDLEAAP
jgi:hypothetical protein